MPCQAQEGGRESQPTAGVFVIMGFEWQKGVISELKHRGDLNQSNNMCIETESKGKCYFVLRSGFSLKWQACHDKSGCKLV